MAVKSPLEAVQEAEVVFLATPFSAVTSAIAPLKTALQGKVLVDCTNPVGTNLSHSLLGKPSPDWFLI